MLSKVQLVYVLLFITPVIASIILWPIIIIIIVAEDDVEMMW